MNSARCSFLTNAYMRSRIDWMLLVLLRDIGRSCWHVSSDGRMSSRLWVSALVVKMLCLDTNFSCSDKITLRVDVVRRKLTSREIVHQ